MDFALSGEKGDLETFMNYLDEQMQSMFDNYHKNLAPKATQNVEESILNEKKCKNFYRNVIRLFFPRRLVQTVDQSIGNVFERGLYR